MRSARLFLSCVRRHHFPRRQGTSSRPRMSHSSSEFVSNSRMVCDSLKLEEDEFFQVATMDALVTEGWVVFAEMLLNRFRRQGHQFRVEVYNKLLFGWAEKGNHLKAMILFKSMNEDGVLPNFESYAALLYLYIKKNDWTQADKIIQEMADKGFALEHILHQVNLSRDQTQVFLELFQRKKIAPRASLIKLCSKPLPLAGDMFSNMADTTPSGCSLNTACISGDVDQLVKQQVENELQTTINIRSVARTTVPGEKKKSRQSSAELETLHSKWEEDMATAIQEEISRIKSILQAKEWDCTTFPLPRYAPFLLVLSAKEWARIVMKTLVSRVSHRPDGIRILILCVSLNESAWRSYAISLKQRRGSIDKARLMYSEYYKQVIDSCGQSGQSTSSIWKQLDSNLMQHGSLKCTAPAWGFIVGVHVGTFLIDTLIKTAQIQGHGENSKAQPAFYHVYEYCEEKRHGILQANHLVRSLIARSQKNDMLPKISMDVADLPMVVPPTPWTSVSEGGFVVIPVSLMRFHRDPFNQKVLLSQGNIDAVLDSINHVSAVPWRVNSRILDLVIEVFNSGGGQSLGVPSSTVHVEHVMPLERSAEGIYSWRTTEKRRKLIDEAYSMKMSTLYTLSVANHFRNTVFWLPHNMDFRSRIYTIPPFLQHMTCDFIRGVLELAVGHPLGRRGLFWLKVHLANLNGTTSKKSLEERVSFVDSHMEDVFDSADHPLSGGTWWKASDDPWQALACCMEISAAIRSGSPESYISHIPVHQDGSCNGLQHYAALGRDQYGAQQVNLIPSDHPHDVYSEVAVLVNRMRARDAANGEELALLLENKITRKVVKQTVMTIVYGVTHVGGRIQVEHKLNGMVPEDKLYDCSRYVVSMIFESVKEMFFNARKIQDWFKESASRMARAGQPVNWITPLGVHVIQPYYKVIERQIKDSLLQDLNCFFHHDPSQPPNNRKQRAAMPPNFVHSLDSTHMMMTALHSHRAGIPFVAVHDSFWTHACYVDEMNKICREQFVALHKLPVMENLAEQFDTQYRQLMSKEKKPNPKEPFSFKANLPSRGDFDLDEVLQSKYFFS